MINYAIENNRIAKEYLIHFTNAAFVIEGNFRLPADADGVFSGFDAEKHSYNRASWNYSGGQPATS